MNATLLKALLGLVPASLLLAESAREGHRKGLGCCTTAVFRKKCFGWK